MSGGYLDYKPGELADAIYNYKHYIHYGLEKQQPKAKSVARENDLEDHEISELTYDLLCLLHSFEWYKSGDIADTTYQKDVVFFKKKWLGRSPENRKDNLLELAESELEEIKNRYLEELKSLRK